jgi:hypothetical protein
MQAQLPQHTATLCGSAPLLYPGTSRAATGCVQRRRCTLPSPLLLPLLLLLLPLLLLLLLLLCSPAAADACSVLLPTAAAAVASGRTRCFTM